MGIKEALTIAAAINEAGTIDPNFSIPGVADVAWTLTSGADTQAKRDAYNAFRTIINAAWRRGSDEKRNYDLLFDYETSRAKH